MTLQEASDWSQIIIAAGTLAAVLATVGGIRATLREVQNDRRDRQRPYVLFNRGGYEVPIEELGGVAVPGLNPEFVWTQVGHLAPGSKALKLGKNEHGELALYGSLRNVGSGPAIDVKVSWLASHVKIGQDEFDITEEKRQEFSYAPPANTMPVRPRDIAPGEDSKLTRLPGFIVLDIDRKLNEVSGLLTIAYSDIAGTRYITQQRFWLSTSYTKEPPHIHITFRDVAGVAVDQEMTAGSPDLRGVEPPKIAK